MLYMEEKSYEKTQIDINDIFKITEYNVNTSNTDKYINTLSISKNLLYKNITTSKPGDFVHYYIPNVISNTLCDIIINESEKYALQNGWTTSRHKKYPTTDLQILSIPNIQTLVTNSIKYDVLPLIAEKYNVSKYLLELNDLFIVKYDANKQSELESHKDGSAFSFNILLNHPSEFEGGGTYINNDCENILVHNTKGGLIIHSGQCLHSGNKITNGKRYILVGFVNYLKTYSINERINNVKMFNANNFKISSPIMALLDDITKVSSKADFILDTSKDKFNVIEKFVYDITAFHLHRLGKSIHGNKKYYSEFWWRTLNVDKDKIIAHNFHYDKDEKEFFKSGKLIHPLLSTVTYLDNSIIPTVIVSDTDKIMLSFPLNNKHLSFNSECFHGVVKVFNSDKNELRKTLMINIWEDHIPRDIVLFKEDDIDQYSEKLFSKEISMVNLDEDINISNIKLSTDIISVLIENIKHNKHKINIEIFKNLIDFEKVNTINLYQMLNT